MFLASKPGGERHLKGNKEKVGLFPASLLHVWWS